MNEKSNVTESTSADGLAVGRRSVLAGTALAVPAIMLTVGTPAFAASNLAIAFANSAYSGRGCSTISGVKVGAKAGTAAQPGVSITVSLADGYTFSTGGTSYSGTTGSDGTATLPDINVPGRGGSSTATATSAGASPATTSLVGSAAATGASVPMYFEDSTKVAAQGVPAGSKPVGAAIFLTSDGRLMNGALSSNVITTDIAVAGQVGSGGANWELAARRTDNTCMNIVNGTASVAKVPAGSTPMASRFFLASDGRMMRGDNGSVFTTNVDSWGDLYTDGDNVEWMPLRKRDGSYSYYRNQLDIPAVGVPASSSLVGRSFFLSPDGRLIDGDNNGYVIASNVDVCGQVSRDWGGDWMLTLRKRDGSFAIAHNNAVTAAIGVPSGSTPVALGLFLTPDRRLIDGYYGRGSVWATDVDAVGDYAWLAGAAYRRIPFTTRSYPC